MSNHVEDLAKQLEAGKMPPPSDPGLEEAAPFLWQMLTMSSWADGTERLCSTIKIERVPGAYRASLVDDALCVRKSVIIRCLEDLVLALERVLPLETVPWEPFKSYRNKKGAKVPDKQKGRS